MLFDEMFNIAQNAAAQQRGRLGFNDTICVARTAYGNIVIGISSSSMMNNAPIAIHAEVDLYNKLIESRDTTIAEMSLFNAMNLQPVLPCNECIARLISLNQMNAGTVFILPDRVVPLSQIGMFAQNGMNPPGNAMNRFSSGQMDRIFNAMEMPQGNMNYQDQQSLSLDELYRAAPVRNAGVGLSRAVSEYTSEKDSDDSGFLKNRLNQLLGDDEEETEKTEKKTKKKFKFFK